MPVVAASSLDTGNSCPETCLIHWERQEQQAQQPWNSRWMSLRAWE